MPNYAVTYKCRGSPAEVGDKKKKITFPKWYSRQDDKNLNNSIICQGERGVHKRILIRKSL